MHGAIKERVCVVCRRLADMPKPKVASERRRVRIAASQSGWRRSGRPLS
jgi:hypothetical protein